MKRFGKFLLIVFFMILFFLAIDYAKSTGVQIKEQQNVAFESRNETI